MSRTLVSVSPTLSAVIDSEKKSLLESMWDREVQTYSDPQVSTIKFADHAARIRTVWEIKAIVREAVAALEQKRIADAARESRRIAKQQERVEVKKALDEVKAVQAAEAAIAAQKADDASWSQVQGRPPRAAAKRTRR